MSLILGIETSCDETAAAVVEDGRRVLSNVIASQHELHVEYGGVVPEIASRAHLERIAPVVEAALGEAGVVLGQLDAVAVGNRPGLIGSLLVGVSAAKALAWAAGKPLVGVDHVRAHLYAGFMQSKVRSPRSKVEEEASVSNAAGALDLGPGTLDSVFPALGLVVSGGHTSLYEMESVVEMRVMGRTIDDAVGEAYDKAAVILGLAPGKFPGGPEVDRAAQGAAARGAGKVKLPRSLLEKGSLDFSFSGLKTALLYEVRGVPVGRGAEAHFERSEEGLDEGRRAELAAAFQEAAVETLMVKVERALEQMGRHGRPAKSILIGGGVSANSLLRARAVELGQKRGLVVGLPAMELCVDNAAMIAGLGYELWKAGRVDDLNLEAIATPPEV